MKNSQELNEALIQASKNGKEDQVRNLLEKGASVDATGQHDITPLEEAAAYGHTNIVKILIAANANVNINRDGKWTALILAANEGYADIAEDLINAGANVNTKAHCGCTALNYAADARHWFVSGNEHVKIVRMLIDAGADVNNEHTKTNETPLMHADIESAKMLIAAGANIEAVNTKWGNTPLLTAVQYEDREDFAQLLLDAGANIYAQDNEGHDVLWHAEKNSNPRIAEMIRTKLKKS